MNETTRVKVDIDKKPGTFVLMFDGQSRVTYTLDEMQRDFWSQSERRAHHAGQREFTSPIVAWCICEQNNEMVALMLVDRGWDNTNDIPVIGFPPCCWWIHVQDPDPQPQMDDYHPNVTFPKRDDCDHKTVTKQEDLFFATVPAALWDDSRAV